MVDQMAHASIEQVDDGVARLLNYANSHMGFAAQRGLLVEPTGPLCSTSPGEVLVSSRQRADRRGSFRLPVALARVPLGAEAPRCRCEREHALPLAGDVRLPGDRHRPLVRTRFPIRTFARWLARSKSGMSREARRQPYACRRSSTSGSEPTSRRGAETRADLAAMRRIRDLTEPGGLLILTTSVGPSRVDEFSRTYDREGLDELFEGWEVRRTLLPRTRERDIKKFFWESRPTAAEPDREAVITDRRNARPLKTCARCPPGAS